MADDIDIFNIDFSSKKGRILMNKLRDSGKEYISNKGQLMPAKVQPSSFCMCPQQCSKKLTPKEKWLDLFHQFYQLADQTIQNQFLQTHIEVRPVQQHADALKHILPNKRRVTCKYYVPDFPKGSKIEDHIKVRGDKVIQVCQRAFMSIFSISEKRLRMQRERSIALLEYQQVRKPTVSYELKKDKDKNRRIKDVEMTPLDLSNDGKDRMSVQDKPLDLSNPIERSINSIEIDKTKLYEIAAVLGVPKETVDKEMSSKYEELVRKNLRKHQREMTKTRRRNDAEKGSYTLKGITEQVVGLREQLAILPMQTLNNGDLTITPVLGSDNNQVENQDIMQVNNFFQNQLWKPEYLGMGVSVNKSTSSYENLSTWA